MAGSQNGSGNKDSGSEKKQATAGEKHDTEHESPDAKRVKTERQTTLDEVVTKTDTDKKDKEVDGKDAETTEKSEKQDDQDDAHGDSKSDHEMADGSVKDQDDHNGDAKSDQEMADEKDDDNKEEVDNKKKSDAKNEATDTKEETTTKDSTADPKVKQGEAVKAEAEKDVPSSILEKGIIYFFIRGRVNISSPSQVEDIARTYMLLRPLPKTASLSTGTLPESQNTRLLALPKKVLPTSGKDRFMVFVEKSGASYEEIKKEFLAGDDYETKTAGSRRTPMATPVGEGVYGVTTTGRESHLVYLLTLPEKRGSAQEELGLKDKGSFILSTKNPEAPGPQNTQLPEGPGFPKEIQEEFSSLRWLPTKPAHLDYPNAQILFIGESSGVEKATEPQKKDKEAGKEEPLEVLENLEEEDLKRMRDLPGDQSAAVFADLRVSADEYPEMKTTF